MLEKAKQEKNKGEKSDSDSDEPMEKASSLVHKANGAQRDKDSKMIADFSKALLRNEVLHDLEAKHTNSRMSVIEVKSDFSDV